MNHQSYSVPENAKLHYIDNLRGIAILMVLITHADKYGHGLQRHLDILVDYCQMGVQLFFVVSAFTLCLSMDRRSSEQESLKAFYLRRYFRIAPLYYFGILLYLCYYSILQPLIEGKAVALADHYTFKDILVNVLMINDFFPGVANNRVVPGGWSIGTETTFYAIFPFIYLLYARFKSNNTVLILLPIIGFVICFFILFNIEMAAKELFNYNNFWFFKQNNSFLYFNIICQLPVFLLGMSLYFMMQNVKKSIAVNKWLLGFAVIGFTLIGIYTFVNLETEVQLLPLAPAISFFFLFLLFKEVPSLSSRLLGRIGQLSFSIYVFHFVFAWESSRFFYKWLNGVLDPGLILLIVILVALALSLAAAVLSEKYLEKPGMELGKRIIARTKKRKKELRLAIAD